MVTSDWITYKGISLIFDGFGAVPRRWVPVFADLLGDFWYRVDRRHRRITLDNLQRAFSGEMDPEEISGLSKKIFKQLARLLFEIGWYRRKSAEAIGKNLEIRGVENLREAGGRGRGILLMTGHLGNWELMPVVARLIGVRLHVVYRPLSFQPLNRFFEHSRGRFGAGLIPTARSMRKILKALNSGDAVALLMDQNFDCHEGVFADFFGHPACTNKGMALLARATGAPVVPVFLTRKEDGFAVDIEPAMALVKSEDKTRDIESFTQSFNQVIESFVRRYPDQWFWVHQRWKTRPYHPWPREVS